MVVTKRKTCKLVTGGNNALLLSFGFTFTGNGGTDVISASIEGRNVFALEVGLLPAESEAQLWFDSRHSMGRTKCGVILWAHRR